MENLIKAFGRHQARDDRKVFDQGMGRIGQGCSKRLHGIRYHMYTASLTEIRGAQQSIEES